MANTIRASKNTFNGGLVMDLAPDTTPNEVLTSALNATLVTFNGNELLLLNDMGNGRVETARLPEGYIPVGTCEFGDIIYIVSYNPITNRSQIGCFPSPERNISSEETGSMGQRLTFDDFLETYSEGTEQSPQAIPNGELKTTSVKKIIYNKTLNPGDKFIIYDKNSNILSELYISDIGNKSNTYGTFPKYLKIHVIAIEESGKINYLDSTLRWYKNIEGHDYFINQSKDKIDGKPDIDSYRNKLSSGYSVFQSKISGKLALLIELEKITGFSCTHTIYSSNNNESHNVSEIITIPSFSQEEVNDLYKNHTYKTSRYYTYLNFTWETENFNINPAAVILTDAEWVGNNTQYGGLVRFWRNIQNLAMFSNDDILVERPLENPHLYLGGGNPDTLEEGKEYTDHFNKVYFSKETSEESAEEETNEETPEEGVEENNEENTLENNEENSELSNEESTEERIRPEVYDSSNPKKPYYEAKIDVVTGDNYTFDSNKSLYDIKLQEFLKNLILNLSNYRDLVLYKLNINKVNINKVNISSNDVSNFLPKLGNYYINAIEHFTSVVGNDVRDIIYSKSSVNGQLFKIQAVDIADFIVNNYFHYPVYKKFLEFVIPTVEEIKVKVPIDGDFNYEEVTVTRKPDLTNMIYKYEITPAMPYGLLREFSVTNYIDFSKIGSGEIALKAWKYFVGENLLTLTLGLEAYVEDNMGISEVAIEFYDNLGVAAVYHILDRESYSGQFTEAIPLNGFTLKSNLNAVNGQTTYVHCGKSISEYVDGCVTFYTEGNDSVPVKATIANNDLYINDCGTLYVNMLYLAKIIVKYSPKDVLGNFDETDTSHYKIFYRWLWTTVMYNDYYYQTNDFNELEFNLTLDAEVEYATTPDYYYVNPINYMTTENKTVDKVSKNLYRYFSANVLVIADHAKFVDTYHDNNGIIYPSDDQDNQSQYQENDNDVEALWTDWQISYTSGTLSASLSCTKTIEVNTSLIQITINDIPADTSIYTILTSEKTVTITFTGDIAYDSEIKIITLDKWAYHVVGGYYDNQYCPDRTLEFKYNPNA